MLTGCLDAELNDVPLSDCPENWGQTQKVIFMHLFQSDGSENTWLPNHATTPTTPADIADWTDLLAASDETKPVQSPYLSEPVSEPGAERTYGGGNATPGGVSFNIGREPQLFEAKFLSAKQDAIKAMKTFQKGQGTGKSTIGVILINEAGQLAMDNNGLADNNAAYELKPFPIHKLFISDKGLGGLENVDHNVISFQFPADWSDNFTIVTPADFNALEDLVNT